MRSTPDTRRTTISRWTIRQRVIASFGAIVTVVIIVAGVAYARLARIDQEARAVQAESIPGLYYSMALQDAWSDDFSLTEGYVLQAEAAERQKAAGKLQNSRAQLDKLTTEYEDTAATAATASRVAF